VASGQWLVDKAGSQDLLGRIQVANGTVPIEIRFAESAARAALFVGISAFLLNCPKCVFSG